MSLRTGILQALDPVELWWAMYGVTPDAWQVACLRSDHRRIVLCTSRQVGKSSVVACKALHMALYRPNSLILLVSRALRQSVELAKKMFDGYRRLGRPVPAEAESRLTLELANKSRIIALPGGDEAGIRGYSADALLLDEAARCPDELWVAMRPTLAASGGSVILLSTPFGRRGFFWSCWSEGEDWLKIEVKASQCPRLSPAFLAQERRELGPRWYAQEYDCAFVEAVGQLFSDETIDAAFRDDITPLFPIARGEEDALLTDAPPLFTEDR